LGGAGRLALRPAAKAVLEDPQLYRLAESTRLGADEMTRRERIG
jgi:diaminohydroxyphosphoribosylaminopyrimidine deaminase/5-amino-6-(5-phosphoribosylamino)uracil reductase